MRLKLVTIAFLLLVVGCGPMVLQSYESENYKQQCTTKCREKYGTDVDWVGTVTGDCYCK